VTVAKSPLDLRQYEYVEVRGFRLWAASCSSICMLLQHAAAQAITSDTSALHLAADEER
jgi:hypothetical protein